MLISANQKNTYITGKHFADSADEAPHRTFSPKMQSDTNVLRGNFGDLFLQSGLCVHFSDTEDLKDMTIENMCKPRLVLSIFLQGAVDATIGDLAVPMPVFDEKTKLWQPIASLRAHSKSQKFVRNSKRGDRLRKVNIAMSPEWLEDLNKQSEGEFQPIIDFANKELDIISWKPSPNSIALAEQIITAPRKPHFYHRLYVESKVLGLLADAFNIYCNNRAERTSDKLRAQDRQRLTEIDQFLSSNPGQAVSAADLAKNVGLSINALRRLTKNARGLSPGKYIRNYMLEYARQSIERDGISIAEAAYLAGYSSPGNFTTAFKRHFQICPSALAEK